MADVPEDLLQQVKHLEEIFSLERAKLKEITDHFVTELEKGMSNRGSFDKGSEELMLLQG